MQISSAMFQTDNNKHKEQVTASVTLTGLLSNVKCPITMIENKFVTNMTQEAAKVERTFEKTSRDQWFTMQLTIRTVPKYYESVYFDD